MVGGWFLILGAWGGGVSSKYILLVGEVLSDTRAARGARCIVRSN